MLPSNISMHDLFFSWLKDCYNFDTLRTYESMDTAEEYIPTVKKHLIKAGDIYIQKKQDVVDSIQLPYLYIDEKYKFARYMHSYSDKELHIALEGGDDFQPLYNIDMEMGSYYLQLLPYRKGAKNEYRLLVIKRVSDSGEYIGNMWIFKVFINSGEHAKKFTFDFIGEDGYNGLPCGENNAFIDKYDKTSFSGMPQSTEDDTEYPMFMYDYDKKSGELFIYNPGNLFLGLRFLWNGEYFEKKDLRERYLYNAMKARRGEE